MAMQTGISWCDSTANLWIGCTKVSGACDHCYAEAEQDHRRHRVTWGPHGDRSYCKQGWSDLRKWQRAAAANGGVDPILGRKRVVFINSLFDFFDNHRSIVWRADAWKLFRECTHLILILVTKRPQLIAQNLPECWDEIAKRVILMTTTEDQTEFDRRVPALLESTAGRRSPRAFGLSIEPMLGPIDILTPWIAGVDWIIVGGESGADARPMHPDWVRAIRDACERYGILFHFKQYGEWAPGRPAAGR